MAITRIQKKANTRSGAGTTLVVTPDSTVTAGNKILLLVGYTSTAGSLQVSSVACTNVTWTRDLSNLYDGSDAGPKGGIELWSGEISGSPGAAITVTLATDGLTAAAEMFEYNDVVSGAPEVTATIDGHELGGSTAPATGTTAVNSSANAVAFGGCYLTELPSNNACTDNGGEATQITITNNGSAAQLVSYEGIEASTAAMNGLSDWFLTLPPVIYSLGGLIGVYAEATVVGSGHPSLPLVGVGSP